MTIDEIRAFKEYQEKLDHNEKLSDAEWSYYLRLCEKVFEDPHERYTERYLFFSKEDLKRINMYIAKLEKECARLRERIIKLKGDDKE